MTRGLELTLKGNFINFTKFFVEAFPRSYDKYGADPAEFDDNLALYTQTINSKCDEIYRMTARDINTYINLYSIHVNQSADEFKIIYYLGRAIEKWLVKNGLAEIAQIHMFAMIGLLDFKLETLGYNKPKLTKAMIKLIRFGKIDEELGVTGCYLTYKCVSTAEKKLAA